MDVRDIMTRNPITVGPETPVATAIDVMVHHKIRHLPVVDDQGAVVGILSDRDLRSAALAPALEQHLSEAAQRRLRGIGATLENLRAKDAMTWNPVTARPDMAVTQAAALMLERRVGSLPVVENGKLVGMLTERDAITVLARQVPALKRVPEFFW